MKKIHRLFYSEERMKEAVDKLIDKQQWYQVEPMPDDEWLIFVKEENEHLLNSL